VKNDYTIIYGTRKKSIDLFKKREDSERVDFISEYSVYKISLKDAHKSEIKDKVIRDIDEILLENIDSETSSIRFNISVEKRGIFGKRNVCLINLIDGVKLNYGENDLNHYKKYYNAFVKKEYHQK